MLNTVENKRDDPSFKPNQLKELNSDEIVSKGLSKNPQRFLERIQNDEIDNVIIRGLPVSESLPETPTEIRGRNQPKAEKVVLKSVADKLGHISAKGVENTIRFELGSNLTNEETWHSHFQYSYSLFYCLRSDPNAEVFVVSANNLMKKATKQE